MGSTFDKFRSEFLRRAHPGGCRILIVEDHSGLAETIAMILGHCGFEVKVAHDGSVVLALAKVFRPRFILLDIRLPGMGGYEVARCLRAEPDIAGTVIIGISAYRPEPQLPARYASCFDHYLMKPFDSEALLSLLKLA